MFLFICISTAVHGKSTNATQISKKLLTVPDKVAYYISILITIEI